MSITHHFWINGELEFFSEELRTAVDNFVKGNNLVSGIKMDEKHIMVSFPPDRPSCFYITTSNEDAMLNMKDKANYSFCNYHHGKYNIAFCELVLLCKYFLKENMTIKSDGFYHGIEHDWLEAQKKINEKGFNIKLDYNEEENLLVFINDEEVDNEFDKDGKIFKTMFKIYKYVNGEKLK